MSSSLLRNISLATVPLATDPAVYDALSSHGAAICLYDLVGRQRERRQAGRDCFVFFDNDAEGHAPKDALRLIKQMENLPGA